MKPRFLPAIRPTEFNYAIDIRGNWHGHRCRFIQRYRSGFPENQGEEFEAPFTALDWISRDRFDTQWRRHTETWFCLHRGLSVTEALRPSRPTASCIPYSASEPAAASQRNGTAVLTGCVRISRAWARSRTRLPPASRVSRRWRAFQAKLMASDSSEAARPQLRQALYMPALVDVRFNERMKAKYQAFIAGGKPPKLALTAIMQMLLILANALIRRSDLDAKTRLINTDTLASQGRSTFPYPS